MEGIWNAHCPVSTQKRLMVTPTKKGFFRAWLKWHCLVWWRGTRKIGIHVHSISKEKRCFTTFTGIENLPFFRIYLSTGLDAICWKNKKRSHLLRYTASLQPSPSQRVDPYLPSAMDFFEFMTFQQHCRLALPKTTGNCSFTYRGLHF